MSLSPAAPDRGKPSISTPSAQAGHISEPERSRSLLGSLKRKEGEQSLTTQALSLCLAFPVVGYTGSRGWGLHLCSVIHPDLREEAQSQQRLEEISL